MKETESQEKPVRGELLTLTEVQKILKIGQSTVYTITKKNELPSHRIGGSIRIDSADLNDYLFFSKFSRGTPLNDSDKSQIFERVISGISYELGLLKMYLSEKEISKFIKKFLSE
jgi:excisionase family DNA binding protein